MPASLPPVPPATPPTRPTNALHTLSRGITAVIGLPSKGINLLNEGFAEKTKAIAAVFPSFPAATLGSLAIGIPHAHPTHPPSGPLPVPPTPIPPVGQVLFGTCVSVLIGGLPAARCGDLGMNPTCCGIPPIFEVFTGSSNVFIGGGRAARLTDLTFHCKPVPPAGATNRALACAMRAMNVAAKVAQAAAVVGDAVEAVKADASGNASMAAAMGLSAAMGAAQMANDALAMAMGAAMGKDPCVPPGTLGAIMLGAPNVLIGGFPMPSWMNVAKGLMKLVKGIARRAGGGAGRGGAGRAH